MTHRRPLDIYRLRFHRLPRGELTMYRGLRTLGFARRDANLIMFGRWTEHDTGDVSLRRDV